MNKACEDDKTDSKCTIIDKILGGMKSEFNKNNTKIEKNTEQENTTKNDNNKSKSDSNSENESKLSTEKVIEDEINTEKKENQESIKLQVNELEIDVKNKTAATNSCSITTSNKKSNSKSNKSPSKMNINEKSDSSKNSSPTDSETKPRIVLTLRTDKAKSTNSSDSDKEVGYDPVADEFRGFDNTNNINLSNTSTSVVPGRRSLRSKTTVEPELKRSARRRSKDCTESVLQSAIARKEKSYNETARPQRLSRRLKPTPKILANLEMCQKNALLKSEKLKQAESKKAVNTVKSSLIVERKTSSDKKVTESDETLKIIPEETPVKISEKLHKKLKRKHKHNKSPKPVVKKSKPAKIEEFVDKESDSDCDSYSSSRQEDDLDETPPIPEDKVKKVQRKSSEASDTKPHRRSYRKSGKQEIEIKTETEEINEPLFGSLAEQECIVAADPESSLVAKRSLEARRCLCQHKSQIYIATSNSSDIVHCAAVDSIDGRIVGCNNVVSGELSMLRPSVRVPYIILCEVHRERLIRHNCCPTCGLFCTQGRFTQCSSYHQYHRECQITVGNIQCCPHCAQQTPDYDVMITMRCAKKPVFLPSQKYQFPSAKMSFQQKSQEQIAANRSLSPPLVPVGAIELRYLCNPSEPREKYDLATLFEAIKENNCEEVATILGTGDVNLAEEIPGTDGYTLLHYASQEGLLAIVHMLLVAGAELDILDREQNTPLMLAILAFKNTIVRYLIKSGASLTLKGTDGMSALHLAAKSGNIDACQFLLDASSDVRNFINSADDGGWTPLVWACEHGHATVVKFLLRNGSDPLLRDVEQNVALHWATFSGSSQITEMLLNSGCDVCAINAHGDSPLHVAARQDKYNCVLMLLARGANVHLANKSGETPLDCCIAQPGDCYTAISLNVQLQAITSTGVQRKQTILSGDISKGKEINPIQCINTVDDESKPIDFVYITENCITSDIHIDTKITSLQSCKCEEKCNSATCNCNHISLGSWYDEEGKLIPEFNYADPPMLFECNPACHCNAITCSNRVVQHGLTQRFQLFRTPSKGWGIRTLRYIPKGAYVCEYVGEVISDLEADQREDDSYLFDLDNRDGETYCIDARRYGNLSRFINHNCDPNLLPARVFIEHQDLRFPRIAFFANREIEANEELGFDYGEKFWIIKYKSFTCMCGKSSCKYSEYTIKTTLENYNKKMQEDVA